MTKSDVIHKLLRYFLSEFTNPKRILLGDKYFWIKKYSDYCRMISKLAV